MKDVAGSRLLDDHRTSTRTGLIFECTLLAEDTGVPHTGTYLVFVRAGATGRQGRVSFSRVALLRQIVVRLDPFLSQSCIVATWVLLGGRVVFLAYKLHFCDSFLSILINFLVNVT